MSAIVAELENVPKEDEEVQVHVQSFLQEANVSKVRPANKIIFFIVLIFSAPNVLNFWIAKLKLQSEFG